MARWVFRVRWRREQGCPGGIRCCGGVSVRVGQGDCGNRAPGDVMIFCLPARDASVSHSEIEKRQDPGALQQRNVVVVPAVKILIAIAVALLDKRVCKVVPHVGCRARIPEPSVNSLIRVTNGARNISLCPGFIEVGSIAGARQGWRTARAKLRRSIQHPWRHVRELGSGARSKCRRRGTPFSNRRSTQEWRGSRREAVSSAPGQDAVSGSLAPSDSAGDACTGFMWVARYSRKRDGEPRVESAFLSGK